MPCYPCTHCNKCGLFSLKLDLHCTTCGEPVIAGQRICPKCGNPYRHNTVRGKIRKPADAADYYTKAEKTRNS